MKARTQRGQLGFRQTISMREIFVANSHRSRRAERFQLNAKRRCAES
jgi:hypothetical protein